MKKIFNLLGIIFIMTILLTVTGCNKKTSKEEKYSDFITFNFVESISNAKEFSGVIKFPGNNVSFETIMEYGKINLEKAENIDSKTVQKFTLIPSTKDGEPTIQYVTIIAKQKDKIVGYAVIELVPYFDMIDVKVPKVIRTCKLSGIQSKEIQKSDILEIVDELKKNNNSDIIGKHDTIYPGITSYPTFNFIHNYIKKDVKYLIESELKMSHHSVYTNKKGQEVDLWEGVHLKEENFSHNNRRAFASVFLKKGEKVMGYALLDFQLIYDGETKLISISIAQSSILSNSETNESLISIEEARKILEKEKNARR